MNLAIAATVFPIIFIGELPDKTLFASLVPATRVSGEAQHEESVSNARNRGG
jgi:hypothetical protein